MTTNSKKFQILVCDGPSCGLTHESDRLVEHMRNLIGARPQLSDRVTITNFTCYGRCEDGPNLFVRELAAGEDPWVEPDPVVFEQQRGFYPGMDQRKVERVLDEHCVRGQPAADLIDDY